MSNVIIVGAGPAGLTLAAELSAFGIPCRIFEQRKFPSPHSRAFSLFTYTLELLDMRGRAEEMIAHGLPIPICPLGDGKNCLELKKLNSRFPYILSISQTKIEEILERFATSTGVEVIRGAKVVGLTQDNEGVTVQIEKDGETFFERSAFVIGCDGARSIVRKLVNIEFDGVSYDKSLMHGDVHLKNPRNPPTYARTNRFGTAGVFPFKDGTFRMLLLDHTRMQIPTDQEITLEEFKESANRLLGTDLGIYDPLWFSRFSCQQRHARKYRTGRVLLSGDAAHTLMPAGGQGLQVSIQDAYNLGWKLANVINGESPVEILDSYEFERRQIANISMKKSSILFRYETSRSKAAIFARWLANKLIVWLPLDKFIMNELFGLRTSYRSPKGVKQHKLVGRRAGDIEVITSLDNKNTMRLYELLRERKFILIDQSANLEFYNSLGKEHDTKIIRVVSKTKVKKVSKAFLVRPDGFIAWASKPHSTGLELKSELKKWFKVS